jgi:hypothetical protein
VLATVAVSSHAVRSDAAVQPGSAAPPAAAPVDTFRASVADGAAQNDLYLFLAAHAGQVVRVSVTVSAPVVQARMTGNPRTITLSSGCGSTAAPTNCARVLGLAGATYAIYDAATSGVTVTLAGGRYTLSGYFAVGQPTRDAKGVGSVPMRALALGGPGISEEDDE